MSDSPHTLPQAPEADGYLAGLRLSGKLTAGFAVLMVLLLIGEPLLLLAYMGYVAVAYAPVVIVAAAFRVSGLRKNCQGGAVPGFIFVTAMIWVVLIALCGWEQYTFMTTPLVIHLP